eukprot:TRINITY_DN2247_c0_g3_i1.p1 TRINITY_DN2247_c0_g3~~TRINITY_DN2247_c0_g3_i1.p1  ORF type:complete len:130 (-),score=0.78 TRINITY_DN2247_c0_g3_i1:3-392(-)
MNRSMSCVFTRHILPPLGQIRPLGYFVLHPSLTVVGSHTSIHHQYHQTPSQTDSPHYSDPTQAEPSHQTLCNAPKSNPTKAHTIRPSIHHYSGNHQPHSFLQPETTLSPPQHSHHRCSCHWSSLSHTSC